MAITIAVSGKGGSGKTTLAALIIRKLIESKSGPILAVDADPNACLGLTLGVEVEGHVSDLREQARNKEPSNGGMDRVSTFEYGLNGVITEAKGVDLVTMGRPEGPDCYCAANNLLRRFLDKMTTQYTFVVLDNEAGMEHLSRRTTNHVDLLLMVSEPSPIGRVTAQRIVTLVNSLPIDIRQKGVLWNRCDSPEQLDDIETLGAIGQDPTILEACNQGKTIFDVDAECPALSVVQQILQDKLSITV